jgi:photosystem II stability/assembly factor-like uncharacterized protein
MPTEHPDLGPDAPPEELRPIHDRLQADARAWAATVAPDERLAEHIRSLPRRFPRDGEEITNMDTLPDRPTPRDRRGTPTAERPPSAPSTVLGRRTLPAVAAAILIVALLGGALYALGTGPGKGRGSTPAPPTATAQRPTATATLALPPSGQGWTKAGPAYFYGNVAAAPSQPATLYSCGQQPSANGDPSVPSYLGISHDGGKTWSTSRLPAYCVTLKVSPSNPRVVAFSGTVCGSASGCIAPPPGSPSAWVYSSTDGGAHWTLAKLPSGPADPSLVPSYSFAWAGTTLFVAPTITPKAPTPGDHILAASANGGPFVWVDQNGLRPSAQSDAAVDGLVGVSGALYVDVTFASPSCVGTPSSSGCSALVKTTDGGHTWATISHSDQGVELIVVAGTPGGDLLAHRRSSDYITGPLLRSTDGGANWTTLPALPGGLSPQDTGTFETPDGTIYVETNTHPNPIYKLAPGASAWVLVAPDVSDAGSGDLAAVTWDASGHPLLLWEPALGQGLFSHPA